MITAAAAVQTNMHSSSYAAHSYAHMQCAWVGNIWGAAQPRM